MRSLRRYSAGVLLVVLGGLVLLVIAALGGGLDRRPIGPPVTTAETLPGPRMHGVHLYDALGDGVSLQLDAASIEPAPGKIGIFVSWLRPTLAVSEARVVVGGPGGEQIIITGQKCTLSKDGRTLVFDRGVRWQRTDQGNVYACRRLTMNLDDQHVAFENGLHLQGPERSAWTPFEIHGFFSPFPTPTTHRPADSRQAFPHRSSD